MLPLVTTAADRSPYEERAAGVVAFVKKAMKHLDDVGETKAFADFSDQSQSEWVHGESYIFCHDLNTGKSLAHGGLPALVGTDILELPDPDGVLVNQIMFDAVRASPDGKAWIEYKWPNPQTHKVAPKVIYIQIVHDHYVCGSGYYK